MAERVLIRSLALQRFAEMESVEVNAADIDGEIEHMIQRAGDEGMRQLFDSPAARESIGRNLFLKKAVDRLVDIAIAGDAPATSDEESETLPAKEEEDENGNTAV